MIKKLSFLIFLFVGFLAISQSSAQSIYFCEDVSSDGYPVSESSTFTIRNEGDWVKVLVRLPYEVACYSVRFEIYRNGNYDNTVYIDTEKNWQWFWQKINFYKSGRYTFYVYDCFDYMLTSGSVNIEWR